MDFGSVFSGIGGIDLGLERAGMTCKWQIENDEFCLKILQKHWPHVPKFGDITVDTERLIEKLDRVDLVAAGFPCQPVSLAGKRKGEKDERWLWPYLYKLILLLRPRFVLLENVPGLLSGGGMGTILSDLSQMGYDAEWDCIRASSIGAPHKRERVYIISYPNSFRCNRRKGLFQTAQEAGRFPTKREIWNSEPGMDRVAYGVPNRIQRVRALGNSVVPQVVEDIGKLIIGSDINA